MRVQAITTNNYNKNHKQPAFGKMIISDTPKSCEMPVEVLQAVTDNPAFHSLTKKLDEVGKDLGLAYKSRFDMGTYPHRWYYERIFISALHKDSKKMSPELIGVIDDIPKNSGVCLDNEAEKLGLSHKLVENIKQFSEKDAVQAFDEYIKNKELYNAKEKAEREGRNTAVQKIDEFSSELSLNEEAVSDIPQKGLWQKFKGLF